MGLNKLEEEFFSSATTLEEKIAKAIDQLINSKNSYFCTYLIREKEIKSPEFAKAALKANIFYPSILYQDAAPETRDQLIYLLDQEQINQSDVNNGLLALAMIGDEKVVEYFKKWEENPPIWRKDLFTGPYGYAMEGNWCIEDGQKKSLIYNTCYAIEQVDTCLPNENIFGGASKDICPYCGSNYINMLVIDGKDERLAFLGLHGKIKIKYCDSCLPWEEFLYCKYEEDQESTVIHHTNGCGEFCEEEMINKQKPFIISKKPVSNHYCDPFDKCAIGGAPSFVDDAKFASCPNCGKRMKHLAQLGEEWTTCGTEYIQICTDCKIAAVTYQQT